MKKIIAASVVLIASISIAQSKFDTLSIKNAGVGIVHMEILQPAKPWTIDVLEIDLSNPKNKIESVKAQNRLSGYQTTSEMALLRDSAGHTIVGAINGDFYASGGIPIGKQMVNGEIVKQNSFYSSFSINDQNEPAIDRPSFSGSIITDSAVILIDNINSTRIQENLILYNSFFGSSTETNQWGTEVAIKPILNWSANDTVKAIVENIENGVGNIQIKKGEAVLSGHGISAQALIDNVEPGDTIKLYLGFTTDIKGITQMIGGYPRIIKDGENYVTEGYNEEGGPPHTFERHPRTAIGFSQDSTKLFFVTVDGRGYSIGMTLNELADFMIGIGVYQGMNLDGGGSTTMFVRDKIVNKPSDGSERPVANSILVYTTYPITDTLSSITISPQNLRIFKRDKVSLDIEGNDKFYNPVNIDKSIISYTVISGIGDIDSNGVFTAGDSAGEGLIIADYEGFKDTAAVSVKTLGKIEIKPNTVMTNTIVPFEFRQSAWDQDGASRNLTNDEFVWAVKDTNIASINNQGVLSGKSDGNTEAYMIYEELRDTAVVTVVTISGKTLLHSFDNLENLSLGGENLNLGNSFMELIEEPRSEGSSSMKVVYEYTGNPSRVYNVLLNTDIEIEGVPDSIKVDLMTNGDRNQMIYFLEDDNSEVFQINVKKWAENSDELDVQPGALSNVASTGPGDIFNFPVRLTGMMIKLNGSKEDGVVYRDSLVIDNLRISYPNITTGVEESFSLPTGFNLYQNYPNPFNPATKIKYTIPANVRTAHELSEVNLKVYDILGREVATLVNERQKPGNYEAAFNGGNLNSGVYFYELRAGSYRSAKKMILLK